MADPRITKYIQKSLDKGFSEEEIRKTLLKAYWVPAEIDRAFKEINKAKKGSQATDKKKASKPGLIKKVGLFGSRTKSLVLRKQRPMYGLNIYMGKKPVFGLDISDYSMEAVQVAPRKGIIKLEGLGRMILKPNIIKDGQIIQKDELSRSIINLLTNIKFGKIRTNDVICSIPESQVFSHVFKFPASLKTDQIRESLRFEAEGVIPLPLDETYYDFIVAPTLPDEDPETAKEKEILFVAARKSIVNDYTDALISAGLHPLAIENETLSLTRSLFRANKIDAPRVSKGVPVPLRGVMILDFGARTTNLSIVDQKGIRLAANIAIAGDMFSETISKSLGISFLEADKIKRDYGLSKDIREGKLYAALEPLFQEIFTEIQKAIKYYQGEKKGSITKILLAGGTSQMPGLIDHFINNLSGPINTNRSLSEKIEIRVGNPWIGIELDASVAPKYLKENMDSVLDNIKTALARRSILYATAIGVALRGITSDPAKETINFLPGKIEPKKLDPESKKKK